MTSHETEPAKTYPKQRLVGALVLLALAVIIIPMVLDLRKGYDVTIDKTNIPPKPDDFRVEVLPLLEDSRPEMSQAAAPPAQAGAGENASLPATSVSEPVPVSEPPEAGEKSDKTMTASQQPATKPAVKREAKKPVVQTARGTKPPPPPVRASKPKPRPKPVAVPAPRKAPPPKSSLPPPKAWVLQVGNFGSSKNAHALRERLRRNGFRAFVDEKVRNGSKTYRVFVGPELVKVNTDILKRELKEDLNLNGIVIPYER